jgi:hypothetical protein
MEEHKVVNLARTTTARDLQRTHLICWRYISVLSFYGPLRFDIVIVVHMKQPNCAIYTRERERERVVPWSLAWLMHVYVRIQGLSLFYLSSC